MEKPLETIVRAFVIPLLEELVEDIDNKLLLAKQERQEKEKYTKERFILKIKEITLGLTHLEQKRLSCLKLKLSQVT